LLWSFDLEMDGGPEAQGDWVEGARFFVLWDLKPLYIKLTPVQR